MRRLLLVGAVAATMAGCAQKGVTPGRAARAPSDSADQVMYTMNTVQTLGGLRKSIVTADTARIYQNRNVAELEGLRVTFFDAKGAQTGVLTSRFGTYNLTTGALDARVDVDWKNAANGARLTTAHLIYDRVANLIGSDSAFVYESPSGRMTGAAFTSDIDFTHVVATQPRGRQRGKGNALPGQ